MSWDESKSSLKRLLDRAGLLGPLRSIWYEAKWLTDEKFRREESQEREAFAVFSRAHGHLFHRRASPVPADSPPLLVVNLGRQGVIVELALVKACELTGFRPVVLADYDRWTRRYYREAGIDVHHWEDFHSDGEPDRALSLLASVETFEQFVGLQYGGVRVGKYAASTALRHLRVGRLDLTVDSVRQAVLPFLARAVRAVDASRLALAQLRPRLALSIDPGYTPRGELFDLCRISGIDTITWNAAHKNNTLMLKRYAAGNVGSHPASLSRETWDRIKTAPWSERQREDLREEVIGSYTRGEWYSEVGTQFHTRTFAADEVHRLLKLDEAKKTAVIFSHIFWDGTLFWGTDLFGTYEAWFVETVKAACANTRVNWIVKVHPANIIKNARDGVTGEPSELAAIRESIGTLPPHVTIIPPDSRINTLSLFEAMDYCLTVRGTVGIEAAAFGIPVLTAGTGRYDRLGFTIDSDSKAEYLKRLACIEEIPPLSDTARNLAERFAHGLFKLRPLTLKTVTLEYQRDQRASLSTKVQRTAGDIRQAPDLRAFAEWVRSGTEDFLSSSPG
jgi:hypothetical protein